MILAEKHLPEALARLSAAALLLVPKIVDGISKFAPYEAEGELSLGLTNTLLPPKDVLFPQTEKMYSYRQDAGGLSVDEQRQEQRQIIFGMRPCDVRSIGCMDKVFMEKGYVDSFYARKRALLTIIAITCVQADPTCFCDSLGLDPNQAPLADVELNPLSGGWLVQAHSPAGEEILQAWEGLLTCEESAALPAENCACSLRVDTDGLAEKLPRLFGHTLWQELARPCLGCGVCAYLCPTCYCFDINAESQGQRGTQFRCWDSCMFAEYTLLAGGQNPRPSHSERLRNRFLHKLAYFEERYGQTLCTGCGRCLAKCPVHIHITEFINKAQEVDP